MTTTPAHLITSVQTTDSLPTGDRSVADPLGHPVVFDGGQINPMAGWAAAAIAAKATERVGVLGSATSDVEAVDFDTYVQHFETGAVYWSLQTGAWSINGDIAIKFDRLGGLAVVGLPVTDEKPALDGVGRVSDFLNGSIYWHPRIGPRFASNAIKAAYGPSGWETGPLGYPTADTYRWRTADPVQSGGLGWCVFENGAIAANPNRSAIADHADITSDTLRTVVRAVIDRKIHQRDLNVGLQPQIDLLGVSSPDYDFDGPHARVLTYRLHAFRDMGLVLPDVSFAFHFSLRFTWNDPPSFIDDALQTLAVQLVDGSIFLEPDSVLGELGSAFDDIRIRLGGQFDAPIDLATFPVEINGFGRVILDFVVTSDGGVQFLVNPLTPAGIDSFVPLTQQKVDDAVDNLLQGP